jgi:hypothetical protein
MTTKSELKFVSIDKEHLFKISIIEDTAYFIMCNINPEKYKTFLLLLKDAYQYMVNNSIKYVKQQINHEDKESFKRSSFIEEDNILIAKTDIEYFLVELCDALGMHRL